MYYTYTVYSYHVNVTLGQGPMAMPGPQLIPCPGLHTESDVYKQMNGNFIMLDGYRHTDT